MIDNKGFSLFDYLDFLVKRKTLLLKVFVSSLLISYGAIYVLIEEQFEATATIIPREEDATSLVGGLARGMKGLPLGLGSKSSSSEMDLYKTIIYSRTMMEEIGRASCRERVYVLV